MREKSHRRQEEIGKSFASSQLAGQRFARGEDQFLWAWERPQQVERGSVIFCPRALAWNQMRLGLFGIFCGILDRFFFCGQTKWRIQLLLQRGLWLMWQSGRLLISSLGKDVSAGVWSMEKESDEKDTLATDK